VDGFFERARKMGLESEEVQLGGSWEGRVEIDVGEGRKREELDERKKHVWAWRMWWRRP
jgi:hypothetical protein